MLKSIQYFKRTLVIAIKRLIRLLGYELVTNTSQTATMYSGIKRTSQLGVNINTVIDIGASNGRWAELCMVSYPKANYLLFEAQSAYINQLLRFKNKYSNSDFIISVVSNSAGKTYFDFSEVGTGIASNEKENNNFMLVDATTIDYEINKRNLPPPYLIKLDTHGFEIPILEGAKNVLSLTNIVVMECYNFRISNICKLFHEIIFYMENLGFRCMDIVDISNRKRDGLLWQMDLIFIRADRPEFNYEKYH